MHINVNGMKSGFVAVVGKPNVGKSTLINNLVGQKVAIVSSKPQTTRHRILAVKNTGNTQIVFVDTPGIHNPSHELGRYMEKTYTGEMAEADLILLLSDSSHDIRDEDEKALQLLFGEKSRINAPVFLVMNKMDLAEPAVLSNRQATLEKLGRFHSVFRTSALKKSGLDQLLNSIVEILPPGPHYFGDDQVSDQNPEFIASETVREKVLHRTREEVPHCVFVHTEEFSEDQEKNMLRIRVIIYVEKNSQKGILIGKGGERLKKIGISAREDLESFFGKKVFLDLWVKVKDDWRDRKDLLRSWGYDI